MAINVTPLLDPSFWFYGKLKRSKAEEYPDLRENRTHEKTLQIQKFLDSKFSLKIPDSNSLET